MDFHFLDVSPFLNFEPPPGLGSEVVEVEAKGRKVQDLQAFWSLDFKIIKKRLKLVKTI